jgi:hypothetical protein
MVTVTHVVMDELTEPMPTKVARVGRSPNDGRWWMQLTGSTTVKSFEEFEDMPEFAKARIAVLLTAPEGFRDEQVGRRIASDAFWIFY